jgi:hypothetical protein
MSSTKTGGPAFPYPFYDEKGHCIDGIEGMTLRDYFAAKAMQSVFSRIFEQAHQATPERLDELKLTGACICYSMADAMLKARE